MGTKAGTRFDKFAENRAIARELLNHPYFCKITLEELYNKEPRNLKFGSVFQYIRRLPNVIEVERIGYSVIYAWEDTLTIFTENARIASLEKCRNKVKLYQQDIAINKAKRNIERADAKNPNRIRRKGLAKELELTQSEQKIELPPPTLLNLLLQIKKV